MGRVLVDFFQWWRYQCKFPGEGVIVDFPGGGGISGFFQREGVLVDFFRCGPIAIFQGEAPVINFYFKN